MNFVMLFFVFTIMFILAGIPFIIIFTIKGAKTRNRESYIKRYGCAPEDFEQIKKYKELLDAGIITQEEFELKKNQIL